MSAISINPHFMGLATRHLAWLADCKRVFEPTTALHRYVLFDVTGRPAPDWLVLGPRRECYANGGLQRLSRVTANDDTVHRAEGDVVDLVGIPAPFEPARFVQGDARIDPTLPNPRECLHFGITAANIAVALGPLDVARAAACLVTRYPLDRADTSSPPRRGPS